MKYAKVHFENTTSSIQLLTDAVPLMLPNAVISSRMGMQKAIHMIATTTLQKQSVLSSRSWTSKSFEHMPATVSVVTTRIFR